MNNRILIRNNVTISGGGTQPIVFAHGFGCDQNMWRYVAPSFEDGYKVILFDFVGSGNSDSKSYDATRYSKLNGYAQDILEIYEALNLKNTVFVGHSVGAMIGILASIQRPELFDKLVLIGPSPRYINDIPDYIGGFERKDLEDLIDLMEKNNMDWANFLAPAVMGNADRPELTQELKDSFCKTDPQLIRQFAKTTFFSDNRKDLAEVTVPSLILQCAQDVIAPLEVGAYVNYRIPNSKLELMEATGHCPHLSHPEETILLMKRFLGSHSSSF
ncbi:sigma factor SigB regulation protein RsbQ [Paenibacillus sp. J31TS4]|uniref:alpha/beta fold hydrolase n=1 Tax=Paenibacillus sp. J31TS4 TaxID=2807195 RepID=UPI001B1199FD|nr:alpha/beta hydrolase [Paenibacillus sp. J31TS4]GIP40428.1 sigma factor SigB regulation protein RsbQ [Paenibacillus sp. J31TS4]